MSHLQKQRCAEAILLASDCSHAAELHLFHHIEAHTGLIKFSKHLSLDVSTEIAGHSPEPELFEPRERKPEEQTC